MTDKSEKRVQVDRRLFLRSASVAAVTIPVAASAEKLVQPTNNQQPGRYKESEHVKRFYALNRR